MRVGPFVLFLLGAAGCTAIYDDFEVVEFCYAPPAHYRSRPPCPPLLRECLSLCGTTEGCYARCRMMVGDNMACGECLDTEATICAVQSECDVEYQAFTCCAVDDCMDGANLACLIFNCGDEYNTVVRCAEMAGCARVAGEACTPTR